MSIMSRNHVEEVSSGENVDDRSSRKCTALLNLAFEMPHVGGMMRRRLRRAT